MEHNLINNHNQNGTNNVNITIGASIAEKHFQHLVVDAMNWRTKAHLIDESTFTDAKKWRMLPKKVQEILEETKGFCVIQYP